jgi:hypothetical protein
MSDLPSTDPVHTIVLELEIDGVLYSTIVVTDDVGPWFATTMGQAIALAVLTHFAEDVDV